MYANVTSGTERGNLYGRFNVTRSGTLVSDTAGVVGWTYARATSGVTSGYLIGGITLTLEEDDVVEYQLREDSDTGNNYTIGGDGSFLQVREVLTAIVELGGGGGTTVTANPGGTGLTDLTTITIGSTDYSLPAGGGGSGLTEAQVDARIATWGQVATTAADARTGLGLGSVVTFDQGNNAAEIPILAAGGQWNVARIPTIVESKLSNAVQAKLAVANPGGAGLTDLTTITIGSTSYALPAGGGGAGLTQAQVDARIATWGQVGTTAAAARTGLGLGTLALLDNGDSLGEVPALVTGGVWNVARIPTIVETKLAAAVQAKLVVANPGGTGWTDLETLTIGSTTYEIPVSTGGLDQTGVDARINALVIANPSGTATSNLSKLTVDGSIYGIPGTTDIDDRIAVWARFGNGSNIPAGSLDLSVAFTSANADSARRVGLFATPGGAAQERIAYVPHWREIVDSMAFMRVDTLETDLSVEASAQRRGFKLDNPATQFGVGGAWAGPRPAGFLELWSRQQTATRVQVVLRVDDSTDLYDETAAVLLFYRQHGTTTWHEVSLNVVSLNNEIRTFQSENAFNTTVFEPGEIWEIRARRSGAAFDFDFHNNDTVAVIQDSISLESALSKIHRDMIGRVAAASWNWRNHLHRWLRNDADQ